MNEKQEKGFNFHTNNFEDFLKSEQKFYFEGREAFIVNKISTGFRKAYTDD